LDYGQGRFVRFHKEHPAGEGPPNTHSVQHFWLCGMCCRAYTLDYRDGCGVVIKHCFETSGSQDELRFVAAA
jgi:hypothetical protein